MIPEDNDFDFLADAIVEDSLTAWCGHWVECTEVCPDFTRCSECCICSTKNLKIIEDFVERVCRQAEDNMEKTHKLEGAHYAAMMAELKKMQKAAGAEAEAKKAFGPILMLDTPKITSEIIGKNVVVTVKQKARKL
jgi:hypothetical protein